MLLVLLLAASLIPLERRHPLEPTNNKTNISFGKVFSNRGILIGIIGALIADTVYMIVDPTLPYKLQNNFGFSESQVGLMFIFFTASVALTALPLLCIP